MHMLIYRFYFITFACFNLLKYGLDDILGVFTTYIFLKAYMLFMSQVMVPSTPDLEVPGWCRVPPFIMSAIN
jgi:hypothetical protein